MELRELSSQCQSALEKILGYLNFSSGARDNQFLKNLNLVFQQIEKSRKPNGIATWRIVHELLKKKIDALRDESNAFQDTTQVENCLDLFFEELVPGYFQFHRDLLFHQTEANLMRPFFVGRMFEALLSQADNWSDPAKIKDATIKQLNDFVGYRPVPVLETQRLEAYPHEKVCPIPLYIEDVGVGAGPYQAVIEKTLELLRTTDDEILRAAYFDPSHLQELAVDTRSYDFEHPVNKRPNYHFGQWDPHAIDNKGFYYRYVVQQVTLNALMQRVAESSRISRRERTIEAAAVLAGTILMASGVSGYGPDTHDSNASLGTLLPRIAGYRDSFYEQLIETLEAKHQERLRKEAQHLRQPFGAARQHLNMQLTRRRASQLEHVRLANVFARMGYPDSAQRKIDSVPVASARMLCQVDCDLSAVQRNIEIGQLQEAVDLLNESRGIVLRGIQCGAIIDPWNILAFDGNFSLFPHMENSIHDHRVEQLVELIDEMCDMFSKVWSASAAANETELCATISDAFRDFTKWWHQYAVHETSTVHFPNPDSIFSAAESVADALGHWHRGGESVGDIRFWAPYVERFDTPRAYELVVDMLLERKDYVASRALLANWLDQAEEVPMEQGEVSFNRLSTKWLLGALHLDPNLYPTPSNDDVDWNSITKFFDYMEANGAEYWHVPEFVIDTNSQSTNENDDGEGDDWENGLDSESEVESDGEDLFSAAYEDVVYRDSTDDGMESSLYDTDSHNDDQLDEIYDHIVGRLMFLNSLSKLRKIAAVVWSTQKPKTDVNFAITLHAWWKHIKMCQEELLRLLAQVHRHRLTQPMSDFLSMAEFDRQRMIRETLLEHIILCSVDMSEAAMFVVSAMPDSPEKQDILEHQIDEDRLTTLVVQAILNRDLEMIRSELEVLFDVLRRKPILYVPLGRGGNPKLIISVRNRQQNIRTLLAWLPRLGLLTENRQLIELVRTMERTVQTGPGAVTEFDDLFDIGYRAMVETVIRATDVDETKHLGPSEAQTDKGTNLVNCLEQMTESMLVSWLAHSRTLRLSVLEKVKNQDAWNEAVEFIKRYGSELFTQQFLSLANIRAVLYQGVDEWIEQIEENVPLEMQPLLLEEIDNTIPRDDACRILTLILEAIVENYSEYRDYNSTTTQSDRGDLLFNLLDFLRLLSNYERVVWNLKPVVLSHELLVRHGCNEAAQMWRRALAERISEEAERYLKKLGKLQKQYAMRLSTIADRLGERFLRPMVIDRMRALVEPSMMRTSKTSIEILEEEAALLMRDPSGVGFDPPQWLIALEDEVQRIRRGKHIIDDKIMIESLLEPRTLTISDLKEQLDNWESSEGDLG